MMDENKNLIQFDSNADAEENNARLNLLYEIGRILASSETMNEAAPQILETICRVLRFELGELWCLGKDEATLRLENVWHLPAAPLEKFVADSRRFRFPVNEGLPGKVWAKSEPVWITDLSSEDNLPRRFLFEETDLRSAFAFPILLGEKLLGVFSFFSTRARQPDEALLQTFAAVGSHIGQFIKRERIESSLRESEDRYRAFITRSTEGIWRFEFDEKFPVTLPVDEQVRVAFEHGRLAECNDAMARMYGLEKASDLVGSRIADLFDMSDAANVEYLRSFIESGYNLIDAESHEKDADGSDKYFLNSLIGTIEDGNVVRVWGTQRDITEQKRHAQAMRESEESYRIVAEAASDAVIKIDEDSRILFVNSAVERIFGYAVEEMLGQSLTMIMPEDLRARHRAGIRRYLETGERRLSWESMEIPARHAKGHTFPLEISFGEYSEHGRHFFIGIARDITDRKQGEKRLTLLAEISEMTRTFEDANEFLFAVSRAVGEHLRVKRCLFNEIDLERDVETVHKDYCRGVESVAGVHRISDYSSITSADMMAGKTVVNRDSKTDSRTAPDYAKTYAPNGERAYVAVPLMRNNRWVASLWVSDDEPRQWSGQETSLLESIAERTWTAIEKLRINDALRESEARFRNMADQAPVMVWVTDTSGYCNYLSQSWYEFTGQTPETGLGFGWLGATHPDDLKTAETVFLAANERRAPFRLEYRLRRADGSYAWAIDSAQPRFGKDGEFLGYIGSVIDITERKAAEEKLRDSEERLQLAVDISRIATFEIDLTTDEVQTDETGRAIYGFEPDEPLTFSKIQSHFHLEDRDKVARQVEAAFAPEGSDEFEVEQRIIRTNGEVRWIRVRGRAFFESEGAEERRAVYCLGTYIDITDSKRGEEALLERERLALLNSDVSRALIKDSSLPDILRACTEAVVKHLDAAFARVWTLNEKENVLELQASSGIYTHLDGEHSRVPVGKFKIGTIAAERQPHLTNSVIGDVRVGDQEWAKREKMVAFAGYPLLVENRLVGVVAMFARQPLTEKTVEALAAVSNAIALGIERKQTEENLRESEERFRLLTENAEDYAIIFLDTDARITKWNVGAERILGWTEAEAVGQPGHIIFTPEDRANRVPENELTTAAENGNARDERWHLRRDGSRLFAFGEMIALYDERENLRGYAKLFRDLTARKRLDDALRESEERFRTLFNSIDEGFAVVEVIFDDANQPFDHRVIEANPAFEKLTGIKNPAGRRASEFAPGIEQHWNDLYGQVVTTGESLRVEQGSEALKSWFDVFVSRVGAAASRRVAVIFTNITERKEIEAARERLLVGEQQARQIAEDANYAKDEFIALVSHELRSPLNAMLGWTRILQEQKPDEKTKEYALDVIVRNARSQSRLIEDLLDIARVGKGKLRLELQPTELIPIIDAAIEIIKPTAEAGNIKLSQTLDRAADFITGDVDRLRQVIENLLSNAVKFTPPGGSVRVCLERDERSAKIIISDTGQGISREFLPQIFERFKQADPSTTRRHGGLGIGLSLARDLVELHGGAISAESAGEGKGATFTVTLPLRMVAPIKENSDKVEFMDARGKLSGFWILAVDDEADARELVSFMLQINGAKVTTANSAVEALDILKSSDGRLPDILLSDISMPNESGYALLEKIRALPSEHGGQIPAVALTAFNRPEDREAAFDAGFQKHLGKPVEPEDLISAIIETAGAK